MIFFKINLPQVLQGLLISIFIGSCLVLLALLNSVTEWSEEIPNLYDHVPYTPNLTVLREESPELFDSLPDRFLENYKSFCWYSETATLLCLPRVYLIGMHKCGTTQLFTSLKFHPQTVGGRKAIEWWTRKRLVYHPYSEAQVSFSTYLQLLKPQKVNQNSVLMDGSSALLWDQFFWESRYPTFDEPPYSNVDMMYNIVPDAKILVVVRNPIDRLWSAYLYFHHDRKSAQLFDEGVRTQIRLFDKCLKGTNLRSCCYNSKFIDRKVAVVLIPLGIYICYIRDWKEKYGDQLKVVRIEDYRDHTVSTMIDLFKFIDVSPPDMDDLQGYVNSSQPVNSRKAEDVLQGDMLGSTRELLDNFFGPYNRELARYLNDDRFSYES